jgi:YfiH family protein
MKIDRALGDDGNWKENRDAYFRKMGIDGGSVVSGELVHGNQVYVVAKKDIGQCIEGVDGLVTEEKNIWLAVTVADCLPVYFFDAKKRVCGIAHAGWRGLVSGILDNMLAGFKNNFSCDSRDIRILIGPHLCRQHFEVRQEVLDAFGFLQEELSSCYDKVAIEKYRFDLAAAAKIILKKNGVPVNQIEISRECTYEHPDKYFSYRRDKPERVQAMVALIKN